MNWLIEEVVGAQPVIFDVWRGDNLTLAGVSYDTACGYVIDHSDETDVFKEKTGEMEPIVKARKDYIDALGVFEAEGMGEE